MSAALHRYSAATCQYTDELSILSEQPLSGPGVSLAPARGVVFGTLLGTAMWVGIVGVALRVLG